MAIARDDRWVADAQGRALSGALVYWLTQPANTTAYPPTPAATIYTDITGDTTETNPQNTDGFGHAFAYMDDTVLYTVAIYHPLFGPNPIILPDQVIGGGQGVTLQPFAGTPSGTINGTNTTFTLTNGGAPLGVSPAQATVWLNIPLIPGVGYVLTDDTITFATAPQTGDTLYASGLYEP